jgi:hypothetical protein
MNRVMFTKKDSFYEKLGADCYGKERNALSLRRPGICIWHPPCGYWSKLKMFCRQPPHTKHYALWALRNVNDYGGILEHPKASDLWNHPEVKQDCIFTVQLSDFGHRARKDTNIYIIGLDRRRIPGFPMVLGEPKGKIENMSTSEREETPELMCKWLLEILEKIKNVY